MKYFQFVTALFFTIIMPPVHADLVRIAVASNFSAPMRSIAEEFEKDTGHQVQLVFGSSGKLYAQIVNGAPFQVFLSADAKKPELLEHDGLALPGSRFTYARGALALWSAKPGYIDNNSERLQKADFRYLAIANERLAPYGAAARDVMKNIQVWDRLREKLVTGENIAQTYQFVSSGNAELGFIALSQAIDELNSEKGSIWIVPQELHAPILQDAVLLNGGEDNSVAIALLDYLKTEKAISLIRTYGYHQ